MQERILVREKEAELKEGRKTYDLEQRTFEFAKDVRAFVKRLPRSIWNFEDVKQLVRASGSVGANYIEANESLGQKDFALHIRISRKEAKESGFWLKLLDKGHNAELSNQASILMQEAHELTNIFGAILRKSV